MLKVSKEQMVGALAALEDWLSRIRRRTKNAGWRSSSKPPAGSAPCQASIWKRYDKPAGVPKPRLSWDPDAPPDHVEELRAMLLKGSRAS